MDAKFVSVLRPFLKYVGDEEIAERSQLRDLGLDSMSAIELLFALEDIYGVSVPDDMLTDKTFETGGSLWSMVEDLRTASGGERP